MTRQRSVSLAANPVLIGAATTLVLIVAVFLAYNANSGLPFVPTYSLKAQVPNAANLVKGNDVRIGGTRVGVVDSIEPVRHADGSVSAQVGLKLETGVKPLPVDSTVLVRPRSALGLKYVELTRGSSSQGFADGSILPLRQAKPKPVELDEALNTFNDATRRAARVNLREFGNAFAGRGADLNTALEYLNPLLRDLGPVMRNLSDPRTRLARLFRMLERTAAIVAPAAETQAALFRNLDTTFAALAAVARPSLQDAISNGAPALDAGIKYFPEIRPFLLNTQLLFHDLRPGVRSLSRAAPDLADALVAGTRTLPRTIPLNARLKTTFLSLEQLVSDPLVGLGVKDLSSTARIANPTVAFLTPVQTVCNYATLWFRNVGSLLSEGDISGTSQRFIIIATPQGPNNEGGPSNAPASGPTSDNYLHANAYPNTASPGQERECEAANEPYVAGQQQIGNVPGNQGTAHDQTTSTKDR
jgi:virulence factor Mce-like protein